MLSYSKTSSLSYHADEYYHKELVKDEQRRAGINCDINITVGKDSIPAHRAVLCTRSSYFQTMFSGNFQESSENTVDFSHVFTSAAPLQAIMEYLYIGTIAICDDTIEDILCGASLMLLDDVRQHCACYMTSNLGPKNCLRMWALANKYSLSSVTELGKILAMNRFHDHIVFREDILYIPGTFLNHIVKQGVTKFVSSLEFLYFLQRWVDKNPNEDHAILLDTVGNFTFDDDIKPYIDELIELLKKRKDAAGSLVIAVEHLQRHNQGAMKPEEETLTEVFVAASTQSKAELVAYIPTKKLWVKLPQLVFDEMDSSETWELIGFFKSSVVFQKYTYDETTIVVSTAENEFKTLPDPPTTGYYGIEKESYFCFDQQLFCLQQTDAAFAYDLGDEENLPVEWKLHRFVLSEEKWQYLCKVPVDGHFDEDCSFSLLVQKHKVFVLLLVTSNDEDSLVSNRTRTDAMFFKMTQSEYSFQKMSSPDMILYDFEVCSDEIDEYLAGIEDRVFLTIKEEPIHVYHIEHDQWSTVDNFHTTEGKVDLPTKDQCHIHSETETAPSAIYGCDFKIAMSEGYLCRLSKFDLMTQTWDNLTPPPFDKADWCKVLFVPQFIIQKAEKCLYDDQSEVTGESKWRSLIPRVAVE